MRTYADATATPVASADTVEKNIGTITLNATAKRIIGVWVNILGGAGVTTLQNVSGVLRLDSPDCRISPMTLPTSITPVLTSSTTSFEPRIIPVNIPVAAQARITGYVTLDLATTIHNTCRFGLLYEGDE